VYELAHRQGRKKKFYKHRHLADQPDVVHFVVLGHADVSAVRNKVPDLGDAKLANLGAEGQFVAEVFNLVLDQELQAFVEGVVFGLHVGVLDQLGQDVFVERSGGVMTLNFSFTTIADAPNKQRYFWPILGTR